MTKAKYTPEQRHELALERGRKLAEWRKSHPMSSEEREVKRRQMRVRWDTMTEEEKKEWAAKAREKAIKQMADPKAREHLSRVVAEQHRREGNRKRFDMTPEIAAKISASQKGKPREWTKDKTKYAQAREKISQAHADRFNRLGGYAGHELFRPDVRERAIANSVEEGKTNPRRGRFETNCAAKYWHLRDPRGVEHHFRNLQHFIRENRHMFTEWQLTEVAPGRTRIAATLMHLSPRNKNPVTCSQGWTWITKHGEEDPRLITDNIKPQPSSVPGDNADTKGGVS